MEISETEYHYLLEKVNGLEQANKKLKIDEEKYRLLLDESSDPIFSFSAGGRYTYVNKRFAQGVGKQQDYIIGKTIWDVFEKEEADRRYHFLKKAFDSGDKQVLEVRVPTPEGDTYYITTLTPQKDSAGNVVTVLCISKDITIRKRAEIELQKSEKQLPIANATKDKFFSIIANDLKNPFNSILGFSKLLLEQIDEQDQSKINEIAHAIHTSGKNTFRLLENLLEWSGSQTGTIKFEPESFLINQLIQDTITLCSHHADAKNICIRQQVPDQLTAYADKNMIQTVVRNLLTNAIKFTNPQGQITITAAQKTDQIHVTVSDNGIGMKPKAIEALFNIHEKSSTPGTENELGTGLGLILCKEFIEKHGSTIEVNSEPGKGSHFSFSLPIVKSPAD